MNHHCENCKKSEHIDSNVYLCQEYERVVYADDGRKCATFEENEPNGEGDQ